MKIPCFEVGLEITCKELIYQFLIRKDEGDIDPFELVRRDYFIAAATLIAFIIF